MGLKTLAVWSLATETLIAFSMLWQPGLSMKDVQAGSIQ